MPTSRANDEADVMLVGAHNRAASAPARPRRACRRVVDEYRAASTRRDSRSAYLYLAQSRVATGMIESGARGVRFRDKRDAATARDRRRTTPSAAAFLDAARTVDRSDLTFHAGQQRKDAFEYFEAEALARAVGAARGGSRRRPSAAHGSRGRCNDV